MPPTGSKPSSPPASSRPAVLIVDQSWSSALPILATLDKLTSSPASADGRSPCATPDGLTTSPCGPAPAPASPSAPHPAAEAAASTAQSTSGQPGGDLSPSVALRLSLVSRLQQVTARAGLPPLQTTSKMTGMRSLRLISVLRSSASPRDSAYFLLPTPTAKANALARSMRKWPAYRRLQDWLPTSGLTYTEWCRKAMGFPAPWASAAPTVTRSTRSSAPSSSEP